MKTYKINQIPFKRILGRNVADAGEKESLNLFWAASALEFSVQATEVRAQIESDYCGNEIWISVFLNGREISRFMVENGKTHDFCLVRNLDASKINTITIYKETQPMPGDEKHSLVIKNITLDDGGKFVSFENDSKRKKIEFIGDSITSGEGLRGAVLQMEWIPSFFAASRSYASQVARNLNADFSCVSQCGWGLRWSWDGKKEASIPPHYENVCSVIGGDFQKQLGADKKYDFKNGFDAVVINLGTNDNSALHLQNVESSDSKENRELFIQTGIDFLKKIREKNPSAKIIWCAGMIKLDIVPALIQKAVEQYKNQFNDDNVLYCTLDAMEDVEKCEEDMGSRGHPGPKTHKLAAEKLTEILSRL